jgi:hypothetical protein
MSCLFQIAQRLKADIRLLDRIAHPAQINIAVTAALPHLSGREGQCGIPFTTSGRVEGPYP